MYILAYEQSLIALESEGKAIEPTLTPATAEFFAPQLKIVKDMRTTFNTMRRDLRALLVAHGYMNRRFMALGRQ
jgi:hypothetical protein